MDILVTVLLFLLGLLLIAMGTYRSPAVALMPDVTPKPLRSKANAIINLMGAIGGILVLVLGIVFGTGKDENQTMSYTPYVCTVCSLMAVAFLIFLFTVKEPKWNREMLSAQAHIEDVPDPEELSGEEKLSKGKLISLILILSSVALWYFGYNAITSKFSVYALDVLKKDFNLTLMIAQAAAILSYVPVGFIAERVGRKNCILVGVALLFAAFLGGSFMTAASPAALMYVLFALAGIGWATINVNSFPMVVELAKGSDIGKYTGYYYTASMAAQIITPLFSGFLMDFVDLTILFPYAAVFVALSFVTMLFVKHGDSKI